MKIKNNKKYSKVLRISRARKYGKFKFFYKNGEFLETPDKKLVYLKYELI
jgi:hypothetical protein